MRSSSTSGACAIVFGVFAVYVQPATILLLGARWHAAAEITPLLCAFASRQHAVLGPRLGGGGLPLDAYDLGRPQLVYLLIIGASFYVASGRLRLPRSAM